MMHERLWDAVSARDASADGLFVYAVRSTRIYCRPTCPSRRPRRDRVEFFPSPGLAAAAGYRACRRCRPDEPGAAAVDQAIVRIQKTCAAVARHPEARWTSRALERASGVSTAQLQRAFRRTLAMSPRDYVAACRQRRFLDTLRRTSTVTDAIYEAGYGSPSRVYEAFALPGMTPATYGRGGLGATIRWATAGSTLGTILVAATDRGLCFVQIGPTIGSLRQGLRAEFPRATIDPGPSSSVAPLAAAAAAAAEARPLPDTLPLDIRGTAFQWRVWRALTRIPRGETRSYAQVASEIGRPSAARAVARACATNPVALLVPCHRVVRADGNPAGYRWGSDVKRALLAKEAASR